MLSVKSGLVILPVLPGGDYSWNGAVSVYSEAFDPKPHLMLLPN